MARASGSAMSEQFGARLPATKEPLTSFRTHVFPPLWLSGPIYHNFLKHSTAYVKEVALAEGNTVFLHQK